MSKNETKKKAEQNIVKQKVEEKMKEQKEEPKKKRKIERDELITVMNYTTGKVVYRSPKTGAELVFYEFGDTDEIEFGELITMKNAYRRYLTEPWLFIFDEDVIDHLGLKQVYENLLRPEEVDRFFYLPLNKMKNILEKAPLGLKDLIASKAARKIKEGTLDSVSKIKLIEETLNVSFDT